MRAAFYNRLGAARTVLEIGDREMPTPGPGEVRVRVVASGVNPSDVKSRAGIVPRPSFSEPIIPHSDGAGIIDEVGEGVSRQRIGERVWIWNAQWKRVNGTCAEFVALPSQQAVKLPDNTSFEAGACLGIPATTAHRAVHIGPPMEGQSVLISGGAGAVGAYAVQFAKTMRATVITTVSSPEKAAYVRKLGADHIIDYRTEDVVERVREITAGAGVHRVIEVDYAANFEIVRRSLRSHGVAVVYGSRSDESPISIMAYSRKNQTVHGILCYELLDGDRRSAIEDLTTAMEAGVLTHTIAARFPLELVADAHEAVECGRVIGNVVIDIAHPSTR